VDPIRIGALGAARITPNALIKPAREVPGTEVIAVAARDPARARVFAARHGIPQVRASYEDLVADPGIDAIYNPLPNSLHAFWTLRALEAGKHVLCEKPFTANAAEAAEVAEAARRSGLVVAEAFHYRYHPLAARMKEIVDTELGEVAEVRAACCVPLPRFGDIRYSADLAGGALMDTGCYALNCLRLLGPGEPEVTAARATLLRPQVDRAMTAWLRYPGGAAGRVTTSLWSRRLLDNSVAVRGERGTMRVRNYVTPHRYHWITVTTAAGSRIERVHGRVTYTHQLSAFATAINGGAAIPTSPSDAMLTMRLIDAVYEAAELRPRGSHAR
jgi:predicted dehydrogenase